MVETALRWLPEPYRDIAIRHRELVKFVLVGGTTWVIDTAIFLVLKTTILEPKPVTAKVISVTIATLVSYGLNRGWSFRTRGGRERHHEAVLYVFISSISVAVYAGPLWVSRYVLNLRIPSVTLFTEHMADFVSGQIVGVLLGMVFRWWAFRRWVFPHEDARPRVVPAAKP
jgi:putative flippase GtrA